MLLTLYRAIVALATIAFVVLLFQALLVTDLETYANKISQDIALVATVADLYLALGFCCLMISVFERRWWAGIALYIPTVFIGGPFIALWLLWRLPLYMRRVAAATANASDAGARDPA